jgi:X-X-X-Leu-X-X-Gly heptad repeat protein
MKTIEDIDILSEEVKGVLNGLELQRVASKLDLAIVAKEEITEDILKLKDSLEKVNSGVKKLQSSVSRLAEKTSKRLKIQRSIQIFTLAVLFLYIAYELCREFLDLSTFFQ